MTLFGKPVRSSTLGTGMRAVADMLEQNKIHCFDAQSRSTNHGSEKLNTDTANPSDPSDNPKSRKIRDCGILASSMSIIPKNDNKLQGQ